MEGFVDMVIAAVYATFIQNLVFSSGYGLSEAIRIARRPKYFLMYAGTVVYFTTVTSLFCSLLDKIEFIYALSKQWHIAVFALVLTLVYVVTSIVFVKGLKASRKFMNSMGICALNTLVVAVPLVNHLSGYTTVQSIGSGIGAGVAFMIAVVLINSGMRRISVNRHIPEAFRGMPAMFLYTALLSLALLSFSGEAFIV